MADRGVTKESSTTKSTSSSSKFAYQPPEEDDENFQEDDDDDNDIMDDTDDIIGDDDDDDFGFSAAIDDDDVDNKPHSKSSLPASVAASSSSKHHDTNAGGGGKTGATRGGSKSVELDEEFKYEVLSPDKIVQHMIECIKEVNQVIQLPPTTTRILLHHFRWDKEKLMERFYDGDQERLFKEAHIVSPFKSYHTNPPSSTTTTRKVSEPIYLAARSLLKFGLLIIIIHLFPAISQVQLGFQPTPPHRTIRQALILVSANKCPLKNLFVKSAIFPAETT